MTVTQQSDMAKLIDALNDKAAAGQSVNFWLRDDDAIEPGDILDRLLQLTGKFHVPLTLAVIPAHTGDALAQRLAATSHVSVAVHGWSHTNYAPIDEKKQELGDHRPAHVVLAELSRGFARLSELHRARFVPLLVPPWNRITPDIVTHLSELGFSAVSTFGDESTEESTHVATDELFSINTQVDIIDWKGSRGGRLAIDLEAEIIDYLQAGRSSIGILSHHLVHDEAAWQFLEQLFKATSDHPGARWLSFTELQHRGL